MLYDDNIHCFCMKYLALHSYDISNHKQTENTTKWKGSPQMDFGEEMLRIWETPVSLVTFIVNINNRLWLTAPSSGRLPLMRINSRVMS